MNRAVFAGRAVESAAQRYPGHLPFRQSLHAAAAARAGSRSEELKGST